jgi:hypothetical protein
MSLTGLLNNPDVRRKFSESFHHPPIHHNKLSLAPPKTGHYQLVGTAFDYLLRFYLKKNYPKAKEKPWVAELVPALFERRIELIKLLMKELDEEY